MDYKHGVVETQRHGLVLLVSPLVALMVDQRSIALVCKHHEIYPLTCMCHFCHSCHYVVISSLITCMHKQVPGLLLPQF